MSIQQNIKNIKETTKAFNYTLVAVSKTKPIELLQEAYDSGQRVFGENKVQELTQKHKELPKDIEWHMIGHLQSNKVKHIAPFVHLIHAVDSLKLLKEINKQGKKNNRKISCLIQLHIAQEDTKFGFSFEEAELLLKGDDIKAFEFIEIKGVMGMATHTENTNQVAKEFTSLKDFFIKIKSTIKTNNISLEEISMGMSGDYKIALENGSTMIRVGSSIFGARNYTK